MATKEFGKDEASVLKALINKELKLRVDWSLPHMRAYAQELRNILVKLEM